MNDAHVPLIWCIDVEPDARIIDRRAPEPWRGFEQTVTVMRELRPWLGEVTGRTPHFSWYYRLDPQVALAHGSPAWPLTHYQAPLAELIDAGDEIGVHPHAYRFDDKLDTWVSEYEDQGWVDHCVRMCFESFREVMGRGCTSFRFGDAWLNHATLRLVEELGARFDLTLEPGMEARSTQSSHERWTGHYPDLTEIPTVAYRPSKDDFRRPDPERRDGVWMIPLTTARRSGAVHLAYELAYRYKKHCAPQPVSRLNVGAPGFLFRHIADRILERKHLPHLGISIRSHMGKPRHAARRMQRNLEWLFAHPRAPRFALMRPDEAARSLGLD
jgi:hypothetical protein